jgi:hypothetical protein
MKKHLLAKQALSLFLLSFIFGAFFVLPVLAAQGDITDPSDTPTVTNERKLSNPLGGTSIQSVIGRAINGVMGVVGSLALLMFVYGGLLWMTSGGSQDKVKKGKDIILWSAIGMVVIFGAYALTQFVITTLTNSAANTTNSGV